ncbi:MAG: M23 family metallopeptidase [Proteobacteria bacterium]|nr:M23 family metallopeptidase [Pseudomonadota bacterium]
MRHEARVYSKFDGDLWHRSYSLRLWACCVVICLCCVIFAANSPAKPESQDHSNNHNHSHNHDSKSAQSQDEKILMSIPALSHHEAMKKRKSYAAQPAAAANSVAKAVYFPLSQAPIYSFTTGGREFGASRDWGRRFHAGVDLVQHAGQAVYAITDGKIVDFHYFYDGTYAVVVDHEDYVIRYGEISHMHESLRIGQKVKAGQKIAFIGYLHRSGSAMLHLEKYSGKLSGPLTQYYTPFLRRKDLVNPTQFIHALVGSYPSTG